MAKALAEYGEKAKARQAAAVKSLGGAIGTGLSFIPGVGPALGAGVKAITGLATGDEKMAATQPPPKKSDEQDRRLDMLIAAMKKREDPDQRRRREEFSLRRSRPRGGWDPRYATMEDYPDEWDDLLGMGLE